MFNFGDPELIAQIDRHIASSVAPVASVFHEMVSDDLHIDIHHVAPDANRPFHALITSGMSALPMNTGPGAEEFRFAELCILLDSSWQLDSAAFADERHYWPIRLLKGLTRYPRENDTWLCYGHTVATGDPPTPFADDTQLCACALLPPMSLGVEFSCLHRADGTDVYFWAVVPLYAEELAFKLESGTDALMDALDRARITDVVRRDRPSALTPRKKHAWWPFGKR